jgi:hypothetical protein
LYVGVVFLADNVSSFGEDLISVVAAYLFALCLALLLEVFGLLVRFKHGL